MLEKIEVPLAGGYAYNIWAGDTPCLREKLAPFLKDRRIMTVADSNTVVFAPEMGLDTPVVIPAGERSKTFDSAAMLCGEAARRGLDRQSVIVALGGGVTGDLAGFTGAIYMRGIRVIQIPTSLLAMVDSSVGGKTAVDIPEGKNLAGAFHQPQTVLIAPAFLNRLPMRERIGALAEVVKYGAALDRDFFDFLEENAEKLVAPEVDQDLYLQIICRSCSIKARIVTEDEKESGVRKYLNYGHTYGHAVELLSDFRLSHGESVAIGMAAAARMAVRLGMWSSEDEERQNALLRRLGLPVTIPQEMSADRITEVMGHDKKNAAGAITLVLPVKMGEVTCRQLTDTALIRQIAEELR